MSHDLSICQSKCYAGTKNKEEVKLLEGIRIQAIDRQSIPLQAKLQEAKTNDEIRAIRRQIRRLRYVDGNHMVHVHGTSVTQWLEHWFHKAGIEIETSPEAAFVYLFFFFSFLVCSQMMSFSPI